MNIITECWKALFQGSHPGITAFGSTVSSKAKEAWYQAFAVCRGIEVNMPLDGNVGMVRLARQDPGEATPCSEMILWAQVLESPKSVQQCVLVEGINDNSGK